MSKSFFGRRSSLSAIKHGYLPVVEEFEERIVPTIAPGVTTAFIGLDYQTFLGRTGSTAEINGWLNSGLDDRQIALSFADSQEYQTDVVNQLYQYYLGTPATPAQWSTALATLAAGGTFEQVTAQQILTSQAYFNLKGDANAAWVTALYQQVLDRTPGTSEVQGWVTVLGGASPLTVANDFLGSAEYRDDLVNRMYEGLVNRLPTSTEMAAALMQPADDQNLATIAANNPTELRGLGAPPIFDAGTAAMGGGPAATPNAAETAYVTGLYEKLLSRVPSSGEVAGWVSAIQTGASFAQVATDFATSTEYRTDAVTALYQHYLNTAPTQAELTSAVADARRGWHIRANRGRDRDFTSLLQPARPVRHDLGDVAIRECPGPNARDIRSPGLGVLHRSRQHSPRGRGRFLHIA